MQGLAAGEVFAGHRIEGVLGRGGMGVVYRAVDEALEREVAMKVIAPELAAEGDFRERFKRESRAAASIRHPNVVPIYHAGERDGVLFVTMQLVDGTDLKEIIARQGRIEPARAAALVAQVAEALDAAHRSGLVHRDVKPGNVLVEERDGAEHVYLTDFGLTKSIGSQSGPTQSGALVGTLDYIAPEQLRGEQVDARSDVYALGAVLFTTLAGRVPYPRDTDAAKLWAHVGEAPPSVSGEVAGLPAAFDEVVRRAMAKAPEERYPSAGDLGRAAVAAAADAELPSGERTVARGRAAPGGQATRVKRPAATGVSTRSPRRRRWLIAAAGLVAALGIAAAALLIAGGSDDGVEQAPSNPAGAVVGRPLQVTTSREDDAWDIGATGERAYVAVDDPRDRETIAVVDGRNRRVTRGFAAHPRARREQAGFDMDVEGRYAWLATARDHLTRVDTRNGTITDVRIPDTSDYQFVVREEVAWVLSSDGELFGVDTASNRVTRRHGRVSRTPLGLTAGGGFVYVLQRNGAILEIDASSGDTETLAERVKRPMPGVRFHDGTLHVLGKDFVLQRIDVETRVRGPGVRIPRFVGQIDYDGADLWLFEPVERRLRRISLRTGRPVGRPIALPRAPKDMAASEGRAWILNTDGTVTEVRTGD
jgi:hypothetical protein